MKRRNFLGFTSLVIAGCAVSQNLPEKVNNVSPSAPNEFKLAVTDVAGLEPLQAEYEAFRQQLSETLQQPITFFPVNSYTEAAIALQNGELDLALTGPSEYVLIRARTQANPIIAITRPNYYSIIITRADTGIQSLKDLQGQTIAMSSIGSTSGHLGPAYLLAKAGIDLKTEVKISFLRDQGLAALKTGKVGAWGGSWGNYETFLRDEKKAEKDFPILAKTPALPNDVLVASSSVSEAFISRIRESLLMNQTTLLKSLGQIEDGKYQQAQFVKALDSDYNMIREAYEAIGQGTFL